MSRPTKRSSPGCWPSSSRLSHCTPASGVCPGGGLADAQPQPLQGDRPGATGSASGEEPDWLRRPVSQEPLPALDPELAVFDGLNGGRQWHEQPARIPHSGSMNSFPSAARSTALTDCWRRWGANWCSSPVSCPWRSVGPTGLHGATTAWAWSGSVDEWRAGGALAHHHQGLKAGQPTGPKAGWRSVWQKSSPLKSNG